MFFFLKLMINNKITINKQIQVTSLFFKSYGAKIEKKLAKKTEKYTSVKNCFDFFIFIVKQ